MSYNGERIGQGRENTKSSCVPIPKCQRHRGGDPGERRTDRGQDAGGAGSGRRWGDAGRGRGFAGRRETPKKGARGSGENCRLMYPGIAGELGASAPVCCLAGLAQRRGQIGRPDVAGGVSGQRLRAAARYRSRFSAGGPGGCDGRLKRGRSFPRSDLPRSESGKLEDHERQRVNAIRAAFLDFFKRNGTRSCRRLRLCRATIRR